MALWSLRRFTPWSSHAARRAIQGHAAQGGGRLHGSGCHSSKHGGDEQAHRGGGGEEDAAGDHLEERQACDLPVRRPHALAHQPLGQVHHRWSAGRRRAHRPQDHHRHLWRLGGTWWRCLLGQGPHQGGPVRSVRLQTDGQVRGEERALQACACAVVVRHRRGKALVAFCGDLRHGAGCADSDDITNVIKIAFDCRPGAIAQSLALREPKYQETAAYCHFGRETYTKDGIKFFEWENAKDLSKYRSMSSELVTVAL